MLQVMCPVTCLVISCNCLNSRCWSGSRHPRVLLSASRAAAFSSISTSSHTMSTFERWNTHFSTTCDVEVLGVNLRLAQDPNSEHLGTTVWDASIVLAKYFEKNIRKGDFSRPKATGKRAIELGAGMGLAGLAFALLGANVLLTDVKEVLPLLQRNYENNISPAALRAAGQDSHLGSCGRVSVAELDWSQPEQYAAICPPAFDYVLAADCIYHETLLRQLYRVMLAITNERSTIIIANERRSESVQSAFMDLFSPSFTFKKVPLAKQDPDFCHKAIELYILKRKKDASDRNLVELEGKEAAELADVASSMQQLAASSPRQESSSSSISDAKVAEQHQQQQEQQQQGVQGQSDVQQGTGNAPNSDQAAQQQQQQQQVAERMQHCSQDPQQQPVTTVCSSKQHDEGSVMQQQPSWHSRRQGVECARMLAEVQVPTS